MTDTCDEDLNTLLLSKIEQAKCVLKETEAFMRLEGIDKLQRKIQQEIDFLFGLQDHFSHSGIKERLQCSNLTHFSAVVSVLKLIACYQKKSLVAVRKLFVSEQKLNVDIVCQWGLMWIKVIARNEKGLTETCIESNYGSRTLVDQAHDLVQATKLYPCFYQTPKIAFVFANDGLARNIEHKLSSLGINVYCTFDSFETEVSTWSNQKTNPIHNIKRVNLDVSAMLAYISAVTNGSAALYKNWNGILGQQAACERQHPVKPLLDDFFNGKQLYCCETAKFSLTEIVKTVGGVHEKQRADDLLKNVIVLPDDSVLDEDNLADCKLDGITLIETNCPELGGKIKRRSLTIFLFGQRIKAVTVSSNEGFVRAAKQQGYNFVTFIHQSRALTEQKETLRKVTSHEDCDK